MFLLIRFLSQFEFLQAQSYLSYPIFVLLVSQPYESFVLHMTVRN